jgi:hypothetical protein
VVRRAGAEHGLDAVYCGGDESDAHHAALFFAQALITAHHPALFFAQALITGDDP